ncbi:hypothetical protein CVT25_001868 [Psilocybe cyanescens]|uniref:Hydrophobin n=1 Tax=Psilocybe cyanescens TaxID=93625 RepID=A0A409WQF9_PSICY|nr:hypothetical protein CVT25_001868 [Psilocybe cyanescens]
MRAFALFAFVFPALVASQLSCDSGTALCCFSTQERTPDSISQLSALPQFATTTIPSDDGDIGSPTTVASRHAAQTTTSREFHSDAQLNQLLPNPKPIFSNEGLKNGARWRSILYSLT